MPKKTFAIGEVLTSSDVNTYLMNQSVMVFTNSTTRLAAIPSPTAGMVTYLTGTNAVESYNGSAWVSVGGGVISLTAGTGVSVSGSTGAVTVSIGQSVGTGDSPTFTELYTSLTTSIKVGRFDTTPTYGGIFGNKGYFLAGNTVGDSNVYLRASGAGAVYIGGSGGNTLSVGNGSISLLGNTGVQTGSWLQVGGTGLTDANSISCSGWFRTVGDTGIYMATYAGGWHMVDSTWMRNYNSKNLYSYGEIRTNGSFSSNVSRQRGSYGAVTIGSNGRSNDWGGIEFIDPEAQTFMVRLDNYSGMYRNNNAWNWFWDYSTLVIGSDERFKREIEPLSFGLNFIESLEPISYLRLTETPDDDPETTEDGYYYGFTAQNVRAALDAVGETRDVKMHDIGGPDMGLAGCREDAVYDRQYIGLSEFIAPMVQAIKELNDKVKALEGAQ